MNTDGIVWAAPCPHCDRIYTDLPKHLTKPCGTPPDDMEPTWLPRLSSERFVEMFWGRVKRGGPDECWEWLAGKNSGGRGSFHIPKHLSKKFGKGWMLAHRFAWTVTNGPIPKGGQINHHCDNGGCVNPAHLYVGTHHDNMQDVAVRGTSRRKQSNS